MRIDPTNTSSSKTFEGDYGSLLDGIYKNNAEGMASPTVWHELLVY